MPTDLIMELCWDIMGRDSPSLVMNKGTTTSAINEDSEHENETAEKGATPISDISIPQTSSSVEPFCDDKKYSSAMVAKSACRNLEEEIIHNREEHKLCMEVLMAKREYYMYIEKTLKLLFLWYELI